MNKNDNLSSVLLLLPLRNTFLVDVFSDIYVSGLFRKIMEIWNVDSLTPKKTVSDRNDNYPFGVSLVKNRYGGES